MRVGVGRSSRQLLRCLQRRAESTAVPAEALERVSLTVNGKHVEVPAGSTILDATRALGIHVRSPPARCAVAVRPTRAPSET